MKTVYYICFSKGNEAGSSKRNKMKTYHALVIANEETKQTIAVQVSAKNLTQAKEEAGKVGRVICVACEKGSKINF